MQILKDLRLNFIRAPMTMNLWGCKIVIKIEWMYKKVFFYSLIIYKFSYLDFYYYFEFKLKNNICIKILYANEFKNIIN